MQLHPLRDNQTVSTLSSLPHVFILLPLSSPPPLLLPSAPSPPSGTSIIQVTATDADDPTYGNSAKLVYTLVQGQQYFSVDPQTGECVRTSYKRMVCVHVCVCTWPFQHEDVRKLSGGKKNMANTPEDAEVQTLTWYEQQAGLRCEPVCSDGRKHNENQV